MQEWDVDALKDRTCVGLRRARLCCPLFLLQHQSSHNLICVSAHSEYLQYSIMLAIFHDELRCNFIRVGRVSTSSRSSEHLQLGGQDGGCFRYENTAADDHKKGQKVNNHTTLQGFSEQRKFLIGLNNWFSDKFIKSSSGINKSPLFPAQS